MARQDNDQVKEVHTPDFERMKRVLLNDIRPAIEKDAKARGDMAAAWKIIQDECHCHKGAAKALNKLLGMSDEARDDYLRTLYGGMKALNIGISQDLVDQMEDSDAPTMPIVPPTGPTVADLATTTH
jgi:hypothetical protein